MQNETGDRSYTRPLSHLKRIDYEGFRSSVFKRKDPGIDPILDILDIKQPVLNHERDNIEVEQIPVDPNLSIEKPVLIESEKVHIEPPVEYRRSTRQCKPVVGTRLIDQIEPV